MQPTTPTNDFSSIGTCLGCICACGGFGAIVAYMVFFIYFLVVDYSVCGSASPLWLYLVIVSSTSVFLNSCKPLFVSLVKAETETEVKNVENMIAIVVLLFSTIYGGIVILSDDIVCDNMKQTGLWIVANIVFWMNLGILSLGIVSTLFLIGYLRCARPEYGSNSNNVAIAVATTDAIPTDAIPVATTDEIPMAEAEIIADAV
jgi:hypothetical protein